MSVLALHILENMTGNANYTSPTPTLSELSSAYDNYVAALAEARSRDKNKVLAKNIRKNTLKAKLDQLYIYVNLTAGNNIEVLAGSGFPLTKERTPVSDMPKPVGFKVTMAEGSGQVHLRSNTIYGAKAYVFQYAVVPSSGDISWSIVNKSRLRTMINGLVPGTQYMFRIAAVGSKGQGPWSDAIIRFVA